MPNFVYDFSGPFMSSAIVTRDGDRIPLWTNMNLEGKPESFAETAFKNAGIYSLPFVTSMSVVLKLNHLPIISLTLSPPYRDAIAIMDNKLIEWGQSSIEVQFGYTSGAPQGLVLSPVFRGVMLKPEVELGEDITITLHAQGGASMAVGETTKTFTGFTRLQVIEQLALGPDPANPRNITVDASEALADEQAQKLLLQKPKEAIKVDSLADWRAIYELVHDCRCWMSLTTSDSASDASAMKILIFPRGKKLSDPPKKIFSLYEYPNGVMGPVANVFPIMSCSSPMAAVFLPGAVKGMVNRGIQSADRKVVQNFFDDVRVKPTRVGEGKGTLPTNSVLPGVDPSTKSGSQFMYGNVDDDTMSPRMEAEFEKSVTSMGIKLEIGSLGVPDLLPGDTVALRGLGVRLNGNYGVMEVTHSLGTGGFDTNFVCISNVSKLEEGTDPKGQSNTAEAEEGSSAIEIPPEFEDSGAA